MLFADRKETIFERHVHLLFRTEYRDPAQRPFTGSARVSGPLAGFSVGGWS